MELYNSDKKLAQLNREYGIAKSTISGLMNQAKPITVDKDITAEYKTILKNMTKLGEENGMSIYKFGYVINIADQAESEK